MTLLKIRTRDGYEVTLDLWEFSTRGVWIHDSFYPLEMLEKIEEVIEQPVAVGKSFIHIDGTVTPRQLAVLIALNQFYPVSTGPMNELAAGGVIQ